MQFSISAILAVAGIASAAVTVVDTEVATSTDIVTITSCAPEVTDCPARHNSTIPSAPSYNSTSSSNHTSPSIPGFTGAAAMGSSSGLAVAGVVAAVGVALLGF